MKNSSLIIYDEPEIWVNLLVNGFEDRYMISSYGRIKSLNSHFFHPSTNKQIFKYGQLRKLGIARGYPTILLKKQCRKIQLQVHRLVGFHFIPNPLSLPVINHIDGNPMNNYYKNLEWCTQQQNILYSNYKGNRLPGTPIADDLIKEIKSAKGVLTMAATQQLFKVNRNTIRKYWRESEKMV